MRGSWRRCRPWLPIATPSRRSLPCSGWSQPSRSPAGARSAFSRRGFGGVQDVDDVVDVQVPVGRESGLSFTLILPSVSLTGRRSGRGRAAAAAAVFVTTHHDLPRTPPTDIDRSQSMRIMFSGRGPVIRPVQRAPRSEWRPNQLPRGQCASSDAPTSRREKGRLHITPQPRHPGLPLE